MTERLPLVIIDGQVQELPNGDSILGASTNPTDLQDRTSNITISNADLLGNVILKANQTTANTITVNSGLTGIEPVMLIQQGEGQTTVVAGPGVSINSADSALKLRTRFSAAMLIPDGEDTYLLVGDIAVDSGEGDTPVPMELSLDYLGANVILGGVANSVSAHFVSVNVIYSE